MGIGQMWLFVRVAVNKELLELTSGNPPHHIAQIIIMNATKNFLLKLEGCLHVMPPKF